VKAKPKELYVGLFLAFVAWTGYFSMMSRFVWLGAGAFLLIAAWRLLHLSQG
jgi:hypothetical protein